MIHQQLLYTILAVAVVQTVLGGTVPATLRQPEGVVPVDDKTVEETATL